MLEGLYHQSSPQWNQPLSPEMGSQSPIGSACSPISVHSPLMMHAPSPPMGNIAHSPMMQAHSPMHMHSPVHDMHSPMHEMNSPIHMPMSVKQEYDEVLHCSNLTHLLRTTATNHNFVTTVTTMGPPHPREILDGKFFLFVSIIVRVSVCEVWRSIFLLCS